MAAIVISLSLLISFSLYEGISLREKNEVVLARVQSVNDFVEDIERDLQKGITITSIRTLLGIQEYITSEGEYISDTSSIFLEGFLQGTIQGQSVGLLVNTTFFDWVEKIQQEAVRIHVNATLSVLNITLAQQDPWTVNVTVLVAMNISDETNTAYWTKEQKVSAPISIIGFEDPLYIVGAQGKVTNTIIPTNMSPLVSGSSVTNLLVHANNSYYLSSNFSPSYLLRLQGSFNASAFGIESVVNIPELQANGIPIQDKSAVDSVYFSLQSTTNYRINNTPSWFKIDSERLSLYGVSNLTI